MMRLSRRESDPGVGWLRPVLYYLGFCLLILSLSRIALVAWQWERFADAGDVAWVLLQGVRFDLISLGRLLGLPLALTPLMLSYRLTARIWGRALTAYMLVVLAAFVFMEAATPPFVQEYDLRPNYLFAEYLAYPREVAALLISAYKLPLAIAAILVPTMVWLGGRVIARQGSGLFIHHPGVFRALVAGFLILLVSVAVVRSSIGHRPANASTVVFSNDALLNTLPLNSLYSLVMAVREVREFESAGFPYGDFDRRQVIADIKAMMRMPDDAFGDPSIPTLHHQKPACPCAASKNLVIVLEESLGAEFVGSLGGLSLTPSLDALGQEGIWFERMYATGTRSVRGIEAVITGFLPTRALSTVKLPRSQRGFFTLASLLAERAYDTSFIYGGSADFDNMRRFFANNGFTTIIDEDDYAHPVFRGSWGVSDEDLFSRAHDYFMVRHETGRPFFSLVFTSSNHTPFEYPDGRIVPFDTPKQTVNNAVRYADHALGQFVHKARQSPYWENTLFLIIADHNSRVYGDELVPIERFHIPALILGADIEPQRVARITSQIDMAPTLLSLIGVEADHPAIGYDLTREDNASLPQRAVMQFGGNFAYLKDNTVVVLQKGLPPKTFTLVDDMLVPAPNQDRLVREALALSAWPYVTYREGSYRLR